MFFRKKRVQIFLLLLVAVSVFITSNLSAAKIVDRIVAVVNDDIITLVDLKKAYGPYEKQIKNRKYSLEKEKKMVFKVRKEILSKLIEQKLTDQEIKKLGIRISEKDIDNQIEYIKEKNYMTHEQFVKQLEKEGLTLKQYRKGLKEDYLRQRLVSVTLKSKIVITDKDINEYYQKNIANYHGETKYKLKHILLKINGANKKLIDEIHKKLKKGKKFEDLSTKYSESSAKNNDGGTLGFFNVDTLDASLKSEISKLKKGEFSKVIDSNGTYQIFKVDEIKTVPTKTVEEVSPQISKKLYNDRVNVKYSEWIKKLKESSHIKVVN